MTEHEKLKRICDEIGFDNFGTDIVFKNGYFEDTFIMNILNVRTLIFNPEFWNKFIDYLSENEILTSSIEEHNIYYRLMKNNLHDPVGFLYNLLFNE